MVPLSLALARKEKRILVVDNTASTRTLLAFHLQQAGYTVWCVASGQEALSLVEEHGLPHLAVVDLQLRDLPGTVLAQRLQNLGTFSLLFLGVPTTQLTLDLTMDLLVKPVIIGQLLSQVAQRLPDPSIAPWLMHEVRVDGRLVLNFAAHYAILDKQRIDLTAVESCLLELLFTQRGHVLEHHFLRENIRAREPGTKRSIATYIFQLRKKLEVHQAHRRYIRTMPGRGYFMPLVAVDKQAPIRLILTKKLRP